jgi:hypothetical protein
MLLEPLDEPRFWLAQVHHQELIRYATSGRLAHGKPEAATDCRDLDAGLRGRVGRLLVSAGRAIEARDGSCNDPCPDGAA